MPPGKTRRVGACLPPYDGQTGGVRTIGLIGGLSWYSTLEYYRVINEEVQRRLGGHSSARVALQSLDFAAVRELQQRDDWDAAGALLAEAGRRCEAAGADLVLICSNLMHKVASDVERAVDAPLLHIADAVGAEASRRGWTSLGLLGTRWLMEEPFYADRLTSYDVTAVVPGPAERAMVDQVIFDELTQGVVRAESRRAYVEVVDRLAAQGAQGVVLACTEIELLLDPVDAGATVVPLLDSMRLHATAAVDAALS